MCYGFAMNAIERLKDTGLTASEIADRVGCTYHAIRYYESGERFPQRTIYEKLIELAKERGVVLLASDFGQMAEPRDAAA